MTSALLLLAAVPVFAAGGGDSADTGGPDMELHYGVCVHSHGAHGEGRPELGTPRIGDLDAAIVQRQLESFRVGSRGGHPDDRAAHPMVAMAGFAKPLSDADIEALAAHIAALRPARAPVEDYPVTLSEEEGLAAFADIVAVSTHPRCLNCHLDGDALLVGDDSQPHGFGITRFSPLEGTHCSACHTAAPVDDGLAPLPPADPIWSMAPAQIVFQDRSPAELCAQLKDPSRNGGRRSVGSTEHIAHDHLLQTSWHVGCTPPPISHEELVKRFEAWGRAGSPCPTE